MVAGRGNPEPARPHPNDNNEEVTVNQKTKRCSKCGETKAITEFYANRKPTHGRPGVKSACKDCENAVARKNVATPAKAPLPTEAEMREWYRSGCRVA